MTRVIGGIFYLVMVENWKHLKDKFGFLCFNCVRIKIVSLTSDFLLNISLVLGQWSVNISLAGSALDIFTLQLTSNQ